MLDTWSDIKFATDYMHGASNTEINWYEYEVNAPALWSLIPLEAKSLLDYGCGPAEFTTLLVDKGYAVDGCDGSPAMIKLASKALPSNIFFVWNGESALPFDKKYDAITSKLTLHFVKDLARLAKEFHAILNQEGSVIISVPHPVSTMPKAHGEYLNEVEYDTEIGKYHMFITMIHRSIEGYMKPFLSNGFNLTDIIEPTIPQELIDKYTVSDEYARIPRRLLMKFIKN